jgi:KH domain
MVDLLPNSLEEIIALRLELTQQEKLVIKESIDVIDGKIKSAINHIGQRPKETASELVATMNKLEHTHNTTPSTNAAERVFMYDMKKLQEKKKYLVEFNLLDSALSDLKLKRTGLQKELREKDASLDELYLGSRKLKLADKLGCSAGEIIEVRFTVPVDKLSQIIGKSGATLQKIEAECKVSLDASESKASTETKVGNIRLTGTELSIATAKEAIAVIVSTVITEIPLSAEICACLILDKNARAHEVESEFDVRIDVSKAKKLCKVTGQGENVESAIKEIRSIPALKIQIPIDLAIIPFVVGKGGATINALAEGNKVIIDVDKTLKLIVVCGYAEDTKRAASILLDIISDNTEVEEIFKINKVVICTISTCNFNLFRISFATLIYSTSII